MASSKKRRNKPGRNKISVRAISPSRSPKARIGNEQGVKSAPPGTGKRGRGEMKRQRHAESSGVVPLPFTTREERLAAVELCLRFWKNYFKQRSDVLPGIDVEFARFAEGAEDDLKALACDGVNPNIVINILGASVWYERQCERARLESRSLSPLQEIRTLSSTDYWVGGRARLERVQEFLLSLMSYQWVGLAVRGHGGGGQDNPFVKLCKEVADAKERVEGLLKTIEELSLCREGWMWSPHFGTVKLVETDRRGVKKSGRGKSYEKGLHWGMCATELHFYLKQRTGKPHWGTIARLLHFAGFEKEFSCFIPRDGQRLKRDMSDLSVDRWMYRERIKKRVTALWKEEETRCTVASTLSYYKQVYERNSDIPGGPVTTRLARVVKVGNK